MKRKTGQQKDGWNEKQEKKAATALRKSLVRAPLVPAFPVIALLQAGQSVLKRCYSVPKSRVPFEEWQRHADDLTLHPKENHFLAKQAFHRPPAPFRVWGEDARAYCVPPQYGLDQFGAADQDVRPHGTDIDVAFEGKLWEAKDHFDQSAVMAVADAHFKSQRRGGVFELPTSSGKTILMMYIITKLLRKKALIVSPMLPVHNQLGRRLQQFLPTARIGTIHQSQFDVQDKDIVIAMLHSLALRDFPEDAFDDFGVVIFDEVDRIATKVFSRVLYRLAHVRYIIGLSATVERADGMEVLFPLFLGPFIFRAPIATKDSQQTLIQCLVYNEGDQKVITRKAKRPPHDATVDSPAMLAVLAKDEQRHAALLHVLDVLYAQHRHVAVLVHSVEYGKRLTNESQARHPQLKMVYYTRTLKPQQREVIDTEPHHLIVATYNIFSVGVDVGYLDTLLMATPRRNITQAVGRLRSFSRFVRQPSLILDVVDNFSFFRSQHTARRGIYRKRKYQFLPELPLVDRAVCSMHLGSSGRAQ